MTFVQRLGTHGGKAPATIADAAHAVKEERAQYAETYSSFVPGS